jgi:DNA-binding XRE family transcriptional regulator
MPHPPQLLTPIGKNMTENQEETKDKDTNPHWGMVIRHFRQAAKVPSKRAAESIGLQWQTYMKIERGEFKDIGINRLQTLAHLFGTSIMYMLTHKENLAKVFKPQ